jgi:hypothetical protein
MKAEFISKNVYGNDLIYPSNRLATLLCQLSGKKTLHNSDLKLISNMDIEVEVNNKELVLYLIGL